MKPEKNTDYKMIRTHKRLMITFVTVLIISLILLVVALTKTSITLGVKVHELEQRELARGVVPVLEEPYENQIEPEEEVVEEVEEPKEVEE